MASFFATRNYRFRALIPDAPGPGSERYPVPAVKSLFGKNNERGLPIGNLTSQFWGNVYLNELDQFVKRHLRCHSYLRYVDDMILVSTDRDELVRARAAIETFVRERLGLTLRPELGDPFPVARGVEFVGWKTWWNRRLPRRRTLGNLAVRLEAFERRAIRRACGGRAQRIHLARAGVGRLRSVLASYSGHLRHGQAMGDWKRVWSRRPWLGALFARRDWRVDERWPPGRLARARRFQAQYNALVRHAGERCLVFCQVGRFVEFRGPQRGLAEATLGLRRVYLPRAGYAFAAGFPVPLLARYKARAIERGVTVVDARERLAPLTTGGKARWPVAVLVPAQGADLARAGPGQGPAHRAAVSRR